MRFATLLITVAMAVSVVSRVSGSDDALERAKAHYEAAAYEEALSALSGVVGVTAADRVQLEQYRALCLIALGRQADAERAIRALVVADPTYVPSATVASPKVRATILDIRARELPGILRQAVEDGRAAYQRKDAERTRQSFELVLTLADDPSLAGRPEVADYKVVARGFLDLAAAATQALAAAAVKPAPAALPPATDYGPTLPAVPIQQDMPAWEPPARAVANVEYNGAIRLRIGKDGRVTSAQIERPSHPAYDARLLQVAYTWLYKPATRNGQPVESERVIAVRLQPTH